MRSAERINVLQKLLVVILGKHDYVKILQKLLANAVFRNRHLDIRVQFLQLAETCISPRNFPHMRLVQVKISPQIVYGCQLRIVQNNLLRT